MANQFNLLSVDLEEWYVVEALAGGIRFEDWPTLTSTLERNTHRLLDLFAAHDVRATWFILGWCAEQNPGLMAEIAAQGHEIACHSYRHRAVDQLTPEQFQKDTLRALEVIESTTGVRATGYRAPSWSINDKVGWAYEILCELGFEYDSSVFPIKHDLYGIPHGPRQLVKLSCKSGGHLYEVPASTRAVLGQNLPLGGGGYLRHSPYWYSKRMIRKVNEELQPAMVYIHPWEIDPNPPRVAGLSPLQRFRTYGSTGTLELKLDRLLSDFEFITIGEYVRRSRSSRIGFEQ